MSVTTSIGKAFKFISGKLASAPEHAADIRQVFAQVQIDADLMQSLFDVLNAEGMQATIQGAAPATYLALDSGLLLAVERIETVNLAEDKFRSCSRIHVVHPTLFPQGISEYQHAMGMTENAAFQEGFCTWARMDLLTLIDATRDKPLACTVIEMNTAKDTSEKASFRQVILGPVAHLASKAAPKKKEEHPFCPCCLFTESMPAFHDLMQSDQFLGVRLFASRDNEGKLAADCRVNGEDFLPATEYLRQYAEKWSDRGLEFRKQYVVIKTSEHSVNQQPLENDVHPAS